jgi:hypothetical protein
MKDKSKILDMLNEQFIKTEANGINTVEENQKVNSEINNSILENLKDEENDESESSNYDESYKDQFLGMSISSLRNILDNASRILSNLENPTVQENLTASWLQGMIAVVENNMSSVHDFVMFSDHDDDSSSDAASRRPGLWDNIRKKKEREGKKYKPAKPGDKDRPDTEMWKKLTKDSKKS